MCKFRQIVTMGDLLFPGVDPMDDDLRLSGALRCGYRFVCRHLHLLRHQHHTDTKVSLETQRIDRTSVSPWL